MVISNNRSVYAIYCHNRREQSNATYDAIKYAVYYFIRGYKNYINSETVFVIVSIKPRSPDVTHFVVLIIVIENSIVFPI